MITVGVYDGSDDMDKDGGRYQNYDDTAQYQDTHVINIFSGVYTYKCWKTIKTNPKCKYSTSRVQISIQ